MPYGYMGKRLNVDLSRKEMREEALDENLCRQFLGGFGLGARVLFSEQDGGVDPFGPDNILGFLTGPFTGTQAIAGTRFTIVGKSPLTGTWGDANCGGYFGASMKFAGYDAIFIKGISERPVYLFVDNGKAELRDASHLWGKDSNATERLLKAELGADAAVSCIGEAGEKLSLISGIMHDDGHAAGRSGLGAVMGSKKLKAVAVRGSMKVPVADEEKTKELRKKYLHQLTGEIEMERKYGTSFVVELCIASGNAPVKNWAGTVNDFPDAKSVGAESVANHTLKKHACWRCPVGCEALMKEGSGPYRYKAGGHRPEYETLAIFGPNLLNTNVESIIMANDICNRYGLDTISAGGTIAFAIECYENGIITKTDTDGLEMTWGNHEAIVAMTEKMGKREGFGDILADGVKVAADKIGKGAHEFAIHVQGSEAPAHNPIDAVHLATSYIADATPGRHTVGSEMMHPQGLIPEFDQHLFTGRAKARRIGYAFQNAMASAGVCLFVYIVLPHVNVLTEFLQSVTGWDVTNDEIIKTGERIANIRQAFTIREGVNPMNYKFPNRLLGIPPHTCGPLQGKTVDKDTLINEFLTEMDWDLSNAKPSKRKLIELGLDDVARLMHP